MRILFAVIVLFTSTLVLLGSGEKTDLDKIQGAWIVEVLTEKGKAVPAKDYQDLEIVVEKDVLTATEKGKTVVKVQIKLDATKKPKHIDFTHLAGEDKGKSEPGIYKFEEGKFTFVLDDDRKARPTAFGGDGTESYSIHVLKRKEK